MLKLNESQAKEYIAELAAKCDKHWKQTVDKTKFMDELREGKLKKETLQLFYKNWGSFVPVINSVYTSAFYKHLWFFVKNVDLMEVYTQKVLDEFGHPSPSGPYSDLDEHRQGARINQRRSAAHADAAGMPRPAGLSPDVDQRRADSRILVFGALGKALRRFLFGLLQSADQALRPHHRRGELFFQAP